VSRFRSRLESVLARREKAKAEREANPRPRMMVIWGFCEKHPDCGECKAPELCVEYADGTHRWASFTSLPWAPPVSQEEKLATVAKEREKQVRLWQESTDVRKIG
jgi:hypothetical protein